MQPVIAFALDALIFVAASWAVWRLLGRAVPIAVVPIAIGLLLAVTDVLPADAGVPSWFGQTIGWIGVLLLAFTAGLETRQPGHDGDVDVHGRGTSPWRFAASAAIALAVPFVVGGAVAWAALRGMPAWQAPRGGVTLGAIAIGLCIAVSALPVLIGIVRELGAPHRRLTRWAVRLAVVDDAVLWIALALLLWVASDVPLRAFGARESLAVVALLALAAIGRLARHATALPRVLLLLVVPAWLAAGAWASSALGVHALLGAYFAGATLPAPWIARVPVERIGRIALLALAPLFFGHSGLRIDGDVLGWAALQATAVLLVVSVLTKFVAALLCPPVAAWPLRDRLALGALLQCKGLMEIVAATILRDQGLLSEHTFAVLVMLAVVSTLVTGPMFRLLHRPRPDAVALDADSRAPA